MNMGNGYGFPARPTVFNYFGGSNANFPPGEIDTNSSSSESDKESSDNPKINMGWKCTSHNIFSESSSSSSGSEDLSPVLDSNVHLKYKQYVQSPTVRLSFDPKITPEIVEMIEMDLDLHDFVSLIFLLYDGDVNTLLALQVLRSLIAAGPEHFTKGKLTDWVRTKPKNWKMKLLEALGVIQNYKVLTKLGYNKEYIDGRFHPKKDVTVFLNRPKKMLYSVCECLTKEQSEKLVELVRLNATFQEDITLGYDPTFLEFHILFWISKKYIHIDGVVALNNLTKHLKVLDFLDKVEEINHMIKSIKDKMINVIKNNESNSDVYPITDPKNVGLFIIINMNDFKNNIEKREEFQHQLPHDKLGDRKGSEADVKNLIETFTRLNFTVVEEHNIKHDDLEQEIHEIIKENFKQFHSVLFVCILSHGGEGHRVYCVNSVPVTVEHIQNIITNGPSQVESLLANKPKVIIIQACQGTDFLFVDSKQNMRVKGVEKETQKKLPEESGQLCCDSPQQFIPKFSDVLICMAIIPGYVAVRSTTKGSIYIRELCDCLRKYHHGHHFLDIVTKVHDIMNSRVLEVPRENEETLRIYMTPEMIVRFRKKLYLHPL